MIKDKLKNLHTVYFPYDEGLIRITKDEKSNLMVRGRN